MSGEDWSDYSSDDPEYEISDHSEMSDSDGSYSDTDDDEDIPTISYPNYAIEVIVEIERTNSKLCESGWNSLNKGILALKLASV
ncbi:hypothetical protein FQA39_LY05810 [Lamprigera yunnana]|nr:hypothetical protein FQA39_LY05810 [Lamprigera yunnana]